MRGNYPIIKKTKHNALDLGVYCAFSFKCNSKSSQFIIIKQHLNTKSNVWTIFYISFITPHTLPHTIIFL